LDLVLLEWRSFIVYSFIVSLLSYYFYHSTVYLPKQWQL